MPHKAERGQRRVRENSMCGLTDDESSMRHDSLWRKGFTLVELLVTIAIMAILAALLLPSLKKAKDMSNAIACVDNHKQLLLGGFMMYANDYRYVMTRNHTGNSYGVILSGNSMEKLNYVPWSVMVCSTSGMPRKYLPGYTPPGATKTMEWCGIYGVLKASLYDADFKHNIGNIFITDPASTSCDYYDASGKYIGEYMDMERAKSPADVYITGDSYYPGYGTTQTRIYFFHNALAHANLMDAHGGRTVLGFVDGHAVTTKMFSLKFTPLKPKGFWNADGNYVTF